MKVDWNKLALEDSAAIYRRIRRDNPAAAINLVNLSESVPRNLRGFPKTGRPGRKAGTRELLARPNYIIIYEIDADVVRILRIIHAARRLP